MKVGINGFGKVTRVDDPEATFVTVWLDISTSVAADEHQVRAAMYELAARLPKAVQCSGQLPAPLAEHFAAASEKGIVVFPNLGGDALMVVPSPLTFPDAYGHLAAFVRKAPEMQIQALWQSVGEAMERRVGAKPAWLSTAGGGVSWLHVRLDDRPKYYGYGPYRQDAEA